MTLNHLAAIMYNFLCLKLRNWTGGQLFVLFSASSLCVFAIQCHQLVFCTLPTEGQKSFFILDSHHWWKKAVFYKNTSLYFRYESETELQRNYAGVRKSTYRSDTWFSLLMFQGWSSLPVCSLCPWKRCRRNSFQGATYRCLLISLAVCMVALVW